MKTSHLVWIVGMFVLSACQGDIRTWEAQEPPEGMSSSDTDQGSSNRPDLSSNVDMSSRPDMSAMPGADMAAEGDMDTTPTTPHIPSGNELSPRQSELFTCSGEVVPSPARLRLLDRQEWRRNVSVSNPVADLNPFDSLQSHPYSTYVEGESINQEILDVYINMSGVAADAWKGPGNWDRSLRWSSPFKFNPMLVENVGMISCLVDERQPTPDDACLNDVLTLLLEKAVLYRPAKQEEVDALVAYARAALDREVEPVTRAQRRDTVRQIVQAAWMTTGALFRREGFDNPPDASGVSTLSDGELAQALAFALGNVSPGAVVPNSGNARGAFPSIIDAVEGGTISQPETIEAIVYEYAARDDVTNANRSVYAMSEGVLNFFREWLGYMAYRELTKDAPHATTAYEDSASQLGTTYHFAVNGPRHSGSSYEPMLFQQLDAVIARILFEDQDVFKQLLTTREYYVSADVGKDGGSPHWLYNLENSTEATQEGRWVTVPSEQRAGVLTHPAWLASHALNFENDPNPVHRGKWIRENMLCGVVPEVPITVEAALDPETKDQNTRTRVKEKTEQEGCAGCHSLMNPLGYPFETYNHIGVMRADDHGSPPDGSSILVNMPDPALEGPVRDAVEMSEKFADSQYVKRCFIRQNFRYYMGRNETMADACVLSQMEEAYDRQGSYKEMLTALFTSPAFLERRHETLGGDQ